MLTSVTLMAKGSRGFPLACKLPLQAVSTVIPAAGLGSQPPCMSLEVVERAEAVLRAHLPDAVSKRIEAGLVEFVSEIRVCTILFIGFPSLKVALHKSVHSKANARCFEVKVWRKTCDVLPGEVVRPGIMDFSTSPSARASWCHSSVYTFLSSCHRSFHEL